MNRIFTLALIIGTFGQSVNLQAQGCVAIRGNASCGGNFGNTLNLHKGEFNAQLGVRHFKSFRHYRGDEEETNRVKEGTEVINKATFIDVSLSCGFTERFYGNVILPLAFNTRSSMYEHGGNPPSGLGERHQTSSYGFSDMRLGVGYWLFNPKKHNYNYSIGLGLKLPTGNYNYKDTFYNQGPSKDQNIEKVVDQSIQLGDGGVGFALDLQGFHPLSKHLAITTNLFYLLNVQETNGILTRNGTSEFSCPDQFAARISGSYNLNNGFNFSLGGRVEGVPSTDIIGGSAGYRRPGYVISSEPGIGYFKNNFSVFASLPVALYRNRTQSYEDKARTQRTGVFTQGDAAFADYLINVGLSYRFGGQKHKKLENPTKGAPQIIESN